MRLFIAGDLAGGRDWQHIGIPTRPPARRRCSLIRLRLLGSVGIQTADGRELRSVLSQPKRLALLAFLAARPRIFHQRDTLLALLWPELDQERARHALNKAVHFLRQELG